ncbi:MAG: phosphoribosylformylglycinamidine synthase subunit PurQ [Nitrososphaeria archaeon]|jgi:phosphoribosylformylglycinamidine synthase
MKTKILIPYGFGLNCEDETRYAFELAGANVDKVHLKQLFERPKLLLEYHLLALVGGFSFGDHISAGKVLGNLYRLRLGESIKNFLCDGKLIFGECNGFQAMVKSAILPWSEGDKTEQTVTLMSNDSGVFEDRWVNLRINPRSRCVFTAGIKSMYLPVRHGEGKFFPANQSVLKKIEENNQIVMQYVDDNNVPTMQHPFNPNGSIESVAGLCDLTGRVFGLMPHPTAFLNMCNHPRYHRMTSFEKRELPQGISIFKNAVQYIEENFR